MLKSVIGLVDGCVCTDTGSTDNSKEIIQAFFDSVGKPCTILDYPKEKYGSEMNFGEWRNYALPSLKDKCDMVYWMDCKEELVFSETFNIEEFKDKAKDIDLMNMIVKTDGEPTSNRHAFFNIKKNFYWKYPLHESVMCKDYLDEKNVYYIKEEDLHIKRRLDGFTWTSQTRIQKYTSHAEFLERYIEKGKGDSRCMYYCANSWGSAGDYKKALKWYRKRASLLKEENFEETYYAQFQVGNLCAILKEPTTKCIKEYLKCSAICDFRAEHFLSIIKLLQNEKRWKESFPISKYACEKFHGKLPMHHSLLLDRDIYEYKLLDAFKLDSEMIMI